VTGAVAAATALGSSGRASAAAAAAGPAASAGPCTSSRDDVGAPDLQAALDEVPAGGELVITRPWVLSVPLEVASPATLRFTGEGQLSTDADISAIRITASGVAVVDAVVRGRGGGSSGAGRGVDVVGTPARPLDDVRIVGGRLGGLSHDGVRAAHVSGLVVQSVAVEDVGYAGVLLLSCTDGAVRGCTVSGVRQPSPFVNSYGIIATRDDTLPLSTTPRSSRLCIEQNTVTDVPLWEGIDTHAGEDVVVRDNTVRDCRVGIAVVPCRDETTRAYAHAPLDVVVSGNVIERTSLHTSGAGIVLKGAGTTVGDVGERASGFVTGNTVRGHGGGASEAGIVLYLTRHVVLSDNALEGCVDRGVLLYHSNDAATVTRTRVTDLVSTTAGGAVSAVEIRSASNTATISATRVERTGGEGDAGRATGPLRGVAVANAGNSVDLLANDWSQTDLAVWNKGATVHRWADGA